ncbi:MAG: hypothetical protein KatS3mg068_0150 [Candidatus Sericytochromatia bacterium]|nr:MAG: hypothetical protein KatS3mg068_0150 [Candidatus Sericytochromatia bacterium]
MKEFINVVKNKNFTFLWFAQILSQLADKIFFLFMVVLVTKNSFSNSSVSILTVFFTIPSILLSAIAGVFVDRWDKKYIMILSNIFRVFFVIVLPFSESLYYIYFVTFFVSTFTQFFAPAESSLMPALVKKDELLSANSLFMSTWLASIVIGFASGERIIHHFGENFAHLIIAFMYILSILCLIIVSSPKEEHKKNNIWDSFINELKEGWEYTINNKIIFYSLIRQIIIFSAFASLSVLVIGFVNDVLYLKPAFFGYLLAISGIGMTIGALLVNKITNKLGKEKVIFLSFILTGISLIILSFTNQIAHIFSMDKVSQQKNLFNSLSTLYRNDSNVFRDINIFLNIENNKKLSFFDKFSSLELKQLKALSNLTSIDIKTLYEIYNDDKISKISIGSFLKRISSNHLDFKLKKDNLEIKYDKDIIERCKALIFFIKFQNSYFIDEIFNSKLSTNIFNIIFKDILILTDNNFYNSKYIIDLLSINNEGKSNLNPNQKMQEIINEKSYLLVKILSLEEEELYFEDIKQLTFLEYLDYIINSDISEVVSNKAKALKNIISKDSQKLIYLLLKPQSSKFEFYFAIIFTILIGFFSALSVIPLQTILQEYIKPEMRGKVFGVQNMAISAAMTIPMTISGFLADALNNVFFGIKGIPIVMSIVGFVVIIGAFIEDKIGKRSI